MAILRDFVSYDPLTGCEVTYCLDTDTGRAWWEHDYPQQAREDALALAAHHRNDGSAWSKGVKKGMAHTAIIPREVRHIWRSQGIDPDSPDPAVQKRINQLLNGEYKYLKTTTKRL